MATDSHEITLKLDQGNEIVFLVVFGFPFCVHRMVLLLSINSINIHDNSFKRRTARSNRSVKFVLGVLKAQAC